MPPRRPFAINITSMQRPISPGSAGASSLLRTGFGALAPHFVAPTRVLSERPFLVAQQRWASQQLSLFGPPGRLR